MVKIPRPLILTAASGLALLALAALHHPASAPIFHPAPSPTAIVVTNTPSLVPMVQFNLGCAGYVCKLVANSDLAIQGQDSVWRPICSGPLTIGQSGNQYKVSCSREKQEPRLLGGSAINLCPLHSGATCKPAETNGLVLLSWDFG